MEYTAGTSWLQQQSVPDVHDTRPTPNDDWKNTPSNVSAGAGPSGAQPGMDLSDFGLDLSGEQLSSNTALWPPSPSPPLLDFVLIVREISQHRRPHLPSSQPRLPTTSLQATTSCPALLAATTPPPTHHRSGQDPPRPKYRFQAIPR